MSKEEIKNRWEKIKDVRRVFMNKKLDISNPELELERILKEEDLKCLEEYETEWKEIEVLVKQEMADEAAIDAKVKLALDYLEKVDLESMTSAQVKTAVKHLIRLVVRRQ